MFHKHWLLPLLFGALIGTLVTLTSVGAGAIGVTVLMILYPLLPLPRIIAADIAGKLAGAGKTPRPAATVKVPKGQARIRVQISAGHDRHHLDAAIAAFTKVGKELGVIK